MNRIIVLALALIVVPAISRAQPIDNIHMILMRSTYRIDGPAKQPGKKTTGTVFILLEQIENSKSPLTVMITANHVLEDIQGDNATLYLTQKQPDGSFKKLAHIIKIRCNDINLWTQHPKADIATIILPLPDTFISTFDTLLSTKLLAGDLEMKKENLCPGEELYCLGYPFGLESSPSGFPILRSGRIASYPVYPSQEAPTILLDIRIFGGNSGGPVFFDFVGRRNFGKNQSESMDWRGIAGLLSQDISYEEKFEGYFESGTKKEPIGLAVVVPAQFIKETITLMVDKIK